MQPKHSIEMEPLLRPEQAAELLGMTPRALEAWRHRRQGPPFIRTQRAIRYAPADLRAWIEQQRRGNLR